uniref:Aminotransferase class I/classII large domain-containing protein n=1 Tax=Ciona savignyi TaxID=51511 RepID=H2Y4L0_CIOSA
MSGGDCLKEALKTSSLASNLQFNEQIKSLNAEKHHIYHLGFGQSPFPPPEFAQKVLMENVADAEYLPVKGLPLLRKMILEFHCKLDDVHHFSDDSCIVGPGTKELIFLLMSVLAGDVLLLSPTWTTYKPQAVLSGHTVYC